MCVILACVQQHLIVFLTIAKNPVIFTAKASCWCLLSSLYNFFPSFSFSFIWLPLTRQACVAFGYQGAFSPSFLAFNLHGNQDTWSPDSGGRFKSGASLCVVNYFCHALMWFENGASFRSKKPVQLLGPPCRTGCLLKSKTASTHYRLLQQSWGGSFLPLLSCFNWPQSCAGARTQFPSTSSWKLHQHCGGDG